MAVDVEIVNGLDYSITTIPEINPSVEGGGDITVFRSSVFTGNVYVKFDQPMSQGGNSIPADTAVTIPEAGQAKTFNPPNPPPNSQLTVNVAAAKNSSGPWCTARGIVVNHGGVGGS